MSYFEFTLGILTGIRTMVSETRKEYPIMFGAVLAVAFLIVQLVVMHFITDPWAHKAFQWIFYFSVWLCLTRWVLACFFYVFELVTEFKRRGKDD